MSEDDARLVDPSSPFGRHPVHFIVHRHKLRAMRSFEHAQRACRHQSLPLYVLQANDEAVRGEDASRLAPAVRTELLERGNPEAPMVCSVSRGFIGVCAVCFLLRIAFASAW